MEQHRRRKQQRSRERKEEAAKEAAAKDSAASARPPQVEVGVADRRLDALIEEEMRSWARSVPASSSAAAEVKRLGASIAESSRTHGPPGTYFGFAGHLCDIRLLS